jgi:hypothetical protein
MRLVIGIDRLLNARPDRQARDDDDPMGAGKSELIHNGAEPQV